MKKIIIFLFISLLLFLGCKNKDLNKTEDVIEKDDIEDLGTDIMNDSEQEDTENIKMLSVEEINNIIKKLSGATPEIKNKSIKKPQYNINKKYQNEELTFKSFKNDEFKNNEIGIIATTGVKMYSDMDGKNEIMKLGKGAVVKIIKENKNPDIVEDDWGEKIDFYNFNNEYNYWYEIEYNNKKGYVFGSYLVREDETLSIAGEDTERANLYSADINERLLKLSYFYTKNDKFDTFYDFNGSKKIPENIQTVLKKDKFYLQRVYKNEYWLNVENPDDMIALYKVLHEDDMATTFITTDFLIHNLHLLFDKMLQDTEQSIFYPVLKILVKKYYDQLVEIESNIAENETSLKEAVDIMKKYFLVPADILGIELISKENYPDDVKTELEYIAKAQGFEKAPIFQYKEDYSQFKPRGHYTKNKILKRYFKAMIWFGRLHFYCEIPDDKEELKRNIKLTSSALLITKIAKDDPKILNLWKTLFIPINYIVGESDDYNLLQYLSISKNIDFDNFGKWLGNDKNIISFIEEANKKLEGPRISGNTLRQKDEPFADENAKAPGGFRFFGQRFTFDSFIHNQLSSPRIGDNNHYRNMVKGIDVMAVFGNKLADKLLAGDKKSIPRFDENYKSLANMVNNFNDTDWRKTFYNSYLKIIKEAAIFDNSMPFYFTQSENWDKKALLTSHAGWAELRHDTILYVKQSYAEKAGKGPEKTWVIDKVKRPIGYIEPNLGVLYWLQSILNDSLDLLVENGFMSDNFKNKFEEYKYIIDNLVKIAELEADDKPISTEQNELIYSVPYSLVSIVLPTTDTDYIEEKELQMALVADVHTDGVAGEVLEVATGIPYRIYVALNDGQGGKRIAEGFTYSYYEFTQPMDNRLNDDQWKEKVYGEDRIYLSSKIPEWLKDIIQY